MVCNFPDLFFMRLNFLDNLVSVHVVETQFTCFRAQDYVFISRQDRCRQDISFRKTLSAAYSQISFFVWHVQVYTPNLDAIKRMSGKYSVVWWYSDSSNRELMRSNVSKVCNFFEILLLFFSVIFKIVLNASVVVESNYASQALAR